MPNFPSIYIELQELWKRLRGLVSSLETISSAIDDLVNKTQCMSYVTSPTPSTVFKCDVRLSGSGNPDLYVDGNIETERNLIVSGSTTLGSTNTVEDNLTINIGSDTGVMKINGLGDAPTTTDYKVLTINNTSGVVKKEDFADIVAASGGTGRGRNVYITTYEPTTVTTDAPVHTLSKPTNAKFVRITCIGGGGGGGGGTSAREFSIGTESNDIKKGGGGGGGGGYTEIICDVDSLSWPLKIYVGRGGIGGQNSLYNSSLGSNGENGYASFVIENNNRAVAFAGGGSGGANANFGNSVPISDLDGLGGCGEYRGTPGYAAFTLETDKDNPERFSSYIRRWGWR